MSLEGYLALVETRIQPGAWAAEITPIMAHYAMNQDFQLYNMLTVAQVLQAQGLFQPVGVWEIAPISFRQPVAHWVEAFYATNGFSRERMGADRVAAFDQAIRHLIDQYCPTGEVEQWIGARVIYGKPVALVKERLHIHY